MTLFHRGYFKNLRPNGNERWVHCLRLSENFKKSIFSTSEMFWPLSIGTDYIVPYQRVSYLFIFNLHNIDCR